MLTLRACPSWQAGWYESPWSQAARTAVVYAKNRSSSTGRSLSMGEYCKDGGKKGSSLFGLWEQKEKKYHQQNLESNVANVT